MGEAITLFLCGDVMTGRGIDQILPTPSAPQLYETYIHDANGYVALAEQAHGTILKPVSFAYAWGDALAELESISPALRIINLETAVTVCDDAWPTKAVNYRMHPMNIPCLTEARIDCCTLANNHVLDWGYEGLTETLATLDAAGIQAAGAGSSLQQAQAPARLRVPAAATPASTADPASPAQLSLPSPQATTTTASHNHTQVLVFSFGFATSGIPTPWGATPEKAGVHLLPDYSDATLAEVRRLIMAHTQQHGQDSANAIIANGLTAPPITIASIHWGPNWGYDILPQQRRFAHGLIDTAGVDIIHGHSSHHPLGIEIYNNKLILYGCGDFLNDYEGIGGYEAFRPDLAVMYFPRLDPASSNLLSLDLAAMQIHRFRVNRASENDTRWLQKTLNRASRPLGCNVAQSNAHHLCVTRRADVGLP